VFIDSSQPNLTGRRPTTPNSASDPTDLIDSDGIQPSPPRLHAPLNTGSDGNVRLDIDFGFIEHTFGCEIWDDLNGDGIYDSNEPPIANAQIELLDAAGQPLMPPRTTTSNNVGHFEFSSRDGIVFTENADYVLSINLASLLGGRYTTTLLQQGANPLVDSNAQLSADRTRANIPFNARTFGTVDCSLDFGLVKLLTLGDRVFNDLNGDGLQDGGDTNRQGMRVELRDSACAVSIANVTTDSNGNYLFTHVLHGLQEDRGYCIVLAPEQTTDLVASPTSPGGKPTNISFTLLMIHSYHSFIPIILRGCIFFI
jgi:hypothetical protein